MKIKLIEKPKTKNLVAKTSFLSIFTKGEMNSFFGGDVTCGIYDTTCGYGNGKSSCQKYTNTVCGGNGTQTCGTYNFFAPTDLMQNSFGSLNLNSNQNNGILI